MDTNLKRQEYEGNKVNNDNHPLNQAPNYRMWPNKNPNNNNKKIPGNNLERKFTKTSAELKLN